MRFNTFSNSFQYGELSPRFLARTDTEQYQRGASKIENMIVLPSGGVTRRPGSVYVGAIPGDLASQRLLNFSFSKTESYCLHLFAVSGIFGARVNRPVSYQYGDLITSATPLTDSDLTTDDLKDLQWSQSGDLVFLSHPRVPPMVIRRLSENSFDIVYFLALTPDASSADASTGLTRPFRDTNTTATTLTISNAAVGTGKTLTASASIFNADMVSPTTGDYNATYFKVYGGATWGLCRVTGFTSATVVTVEVLIAFDGTAGYDTWAESSWSQYRGWPSTVGIFESRLIFGGNSAEPDRVWGSMAFNLLHFCQPRDFPTLVYTGTAVDTDPFQFSPSAREVNTINWVQSGRVLTVGTLGQEFVATGGAERVLSSTSVAFTDQTTIGSSSTQAIRVNKSTIFVSRDGLRIYAYNFDNDSQSYVADDLTALAEHVVIQSKLDEMSEDEDLTTSTDSVASFHIKELHWQPSRSCLWAITSSNHLIGLTWNPQTKTLAWHRHILGGNYANLSPPKVISAAVIPSEDGYTDNLWILVQRYINGSPATSLEIIGPDYLVPGLLTGITSLSDGEMPIYMDSAIVVNNSPASATVSGLTHLIAEDVVVIADGFYAGTYNVDNSGEIELSREAETVIVGIPYTPRIKLAPTSPESPLGSSMGMTYRVDRMTVRFFNTLRAVITGPGGTDEKPQFLPIGYESGAPLVPFSGDKKINVPMGPEIRAELEISSDQPMPLTVLGVVLRGQLNE